MIVNYLEFGLCSGTFYIIAAAKIIGPAKRDRRYVRAQRIGLIKVRFHLCYHIIQELGRHVL